LETEENIQTEPIDFFLHVLEIELVDIRDCFELGYRLVMPYQLHTLSKFFRSYFFTFPLAGNCWCIYLVLSALTLPFLVVEDATA
jgi:hypothetical protein